ncbi:Topors protein [Aphelenchoides avenae]|nr:Topors protein [Aphelenchus avenae]
MADDEQSMTDNSTHSHDGNAPNKAELGSKRKLTEEAEPTNSNPKQKKVSEASAGDSNCPICLNTLNDATVLNACPHVFCYECICEWLKMKAECPLCKRSLQNLKHNLNLEVDEKPTFESSGDRHVPLNMSLESIRSSTSYAAEVERFAVTEVIQRVNRELDFIRSVNNTSYTRDQTYNERVEHLRHELHCYEELLQMFDNASRSEIFDHPCFRRVIYIRNLTPRAITPARFALAFTPMYVRENEAAVRSHILRFVVRDITATTGSVGDSSLIYRCKAQIQDVIDVDLVLDKIISYLKGEIKRLDITTFLNSRGMRHPHHFLNNLQHFGESGQTLQVYDQNTEYVPRTEMHRFHRQTDDDVIMMGETYNNDVQVVGGAQRAERQAHLQREFDNLANRRRIQQRNEALGFGGLVEPSRQRLFSPRRQSRHRSDEVLQLESESEDSDSDVEVMRHQRPSPPRGVSGGSNRRVMANRSTPRNHDPSVTENINRLRSNFAASGFPGERGSMFRNYDTTFSRPRNSSRDVSPRADRRQRRSSPPPARHHRAHGSFDSRLNSTAPAEVSSGDEDVYTHSSCRLPRVAGSSALNLPSPRYQQGYGVDIGQSSGPGWFQRSSLMDTLRNFLGNASATAAGPSAMSYAPTFGYAGRMHAPAGSAHLPPPQVASQYQPGEHGPSGDNAPSNDEHVHDNDDVEVIDVDDVEVIREPRNQRQMRYGHEEHMDV